MLIEFTTHLPCTHFKPASITSHFERVDHDRHARDIRLGRDQIQERAIAAFESSIASSMLMSIICAPFSTCWRATRQRGSRNRRPGSACAKRRRSGDIGALADVDEQRVVADVERLETATSAVRCSIVRQFARRQAFHRLARWRWICAGVVPQQPPAILMNPLRAKSSTSYEPSAPASRRSRCRQADSAGPRSDMHDT